MKYKLNYLKRLIIIIQWGIPMVAYSISAAPMDSLPIDSSIRFGKLNNGITYYIKHVNNSSKMELSLVVKTGTFYQTKKQHNTAHLIEHLPFRYTKNFPGTRIESNPIIKKLKLYNFTGNTSMLHTTYALNVPLTSGLNGLSGALLWLKDIGSLKINHYDIKSEAGILRQETLYRTKNIFDWSRANNKRESIIFPCTPNPSGCFSNPEKVSAIEVKRFYQKWYRPDRMGLIIVGNIQDLNVLEDRIKTIFSELHLPDSNNPTCKCEEVFLKSKSKFAIIEKKTSGWVQEEKPPVEVFLNFRKKDPTLRKAYSTEALKHSLIWNAIERLIVHRLNDYGLNSVLTDQRNPEKPYLQISFEDSEGLEKLKTQKIIQLLAQLTTYGFSSKEWKLIQNDMLQHFTEKLGANTVAFWNSQITNHFVYHETLPANKSDVFKELIQSMTYLNLNKYILENFKASPDDISMLAPTNNKALDYTEFEVRDWIYQALTKPITPFKSLTKNNNQIKKVDDESVLNQSDLRELPLVGISRMETNNDTGTDIIVLDNGIRIVLNNNEPSQKHNNSISIHGFTPVGANFFPAKDYYSAINAVDLIQNKKNSKKIRKYINNSTSGLKIHGNANKLEEIFQLIYFSFKAPRAPTKEEYEEWKRNAEKEYFYPVFDLVVNDFLEYQRGFFGDSSNVPRATNRFYGIPKTDPKKSFRIYKKLLADASKYTFIISGEFTTSQVIPLLRKYIGNLPVLENKDLNNYHTTVEIEKTSLVKAPIYKVFYLENLKPSYSLRNVPYQLSYRIHHKNDIWDWKKQVKLITLAKIIQPRLDNLRYEKKAGLYGINYATTSFNHTLKSSMISINLACQADELEWLKKECHNIINELKVNGIRENEFEEIIKNQVLPYYTRRLNKKPSSDEIYKYFRFGTLIINKQDQINYLRSLATKDIQEVAKEYFNRDNLYEFEIRNTK